MKTKRLVLGFTLLLVCLAIIAVVIRREEEPKMISMEEVLEDSHGAKQYEGRLVKTKGEIFGGWGSSNEMLLGPSTDNPSWLIEVFLSGGKTRLAKQWDEVIRMRVHNVSVEGRLYYGGFYGVRLLDARIVEPFLDSWIMFELAPDILAMIAFVALLVLFQITRKARKFGFNRCFQRRKSVSA